MIIIVDVQTADVHTIFALQLVVVVMRFKIRYYFSQSCNIFLARAATKSQFHLDEVQCILNGSMGQGSLKEEHKHTQLSIEFNEFSFYYIN